MATFSLFHERKPSNNCTKIANGNSLELKASVIKGEAGKKEKSL